MVVAPLNNLVLARLHQCLEFWTRRGYQFVNLPWLVPQRFSDYTKPAFVTTPDPVTPHGVLVASGEQAFLALWEQGWLEAGGRYIGWSPCFRDETVFDESHHFYFLKAELFVPKPPVAEQALRDILDGSGAMMDALAGPGLVLDELTVTADQVDLMLAGVEVGSYGQRELPSGGAYIYGTALAEPRFSTALASFNALR